MDSAEGVHIRVFVEHLEDNPEITCLTVAVYPLPSDILGELSFAMRDAATEFLKEHGLTSGVVRDLNAGKGH